jgi:type IV secretory pathway VirD2 relaxase
VNVLFWSLKAMMEQSFDTRLDGWLVAHVNTGHPHTHIVIRGQDDRGRDLVMARDYIAHTPIAKPWHR